MSLINYKDVENELWVRDDLKLHQLRLLQSMDEQLARNALIETKLELENQQHYEVRDYLSRIEQLDQDQLRFFRERMITLDRTEYYLKKVQKKQKEYLEMAKKFKFSDQGKEDFLWHRKYYYLSTIESAANHYNLNGFLKECSELQKVLPHAKIYY